MCPVTLTAIGTGLATAAATAGTAAAGAAGTVASAVGFGGAGAAAAGAGSALSLSSLLQIGGLATSVIGGVATATTQAQASKANSALAARQADEQRQLGQIAEQRSRDDFRDIASQQTAQLAASGVRLDSPTALQIGVETAQEATRDAQAVRHGAVSRANALDAESSIYRRQARSQRMRGYTGAASSILTAAPSIWPSLKAA